MGSIPLIRASGAKLFVPFLERIGAPVLSLWTRSGLPPRSFEEAESLVPLHHVLRFAEEASRTEGIPNLGALAAQHAGFSSNSEFLQRISRARSLAKAFETAQALVGGHNSGAQYWVVSQGEEVRLCRRMNAERGATRQADLLTASLMVELVRCVAGNDWRPRELSFQSTGHERLSELEILGDARIAEGRLATSITLPRSLLMIPLRRPTGPDHTPRTPDLWLATSPPRDFAESVRTLVRSLLPLGATSVETVAEAARLSVRSLQRRLAEEGMSHSQIVEDVRYSLACQMLEQSDLKLIEISYELGYSDPAHFTRAFRRWNTVNPSEYRRMHRIDPAPRRKAAP